MSKLKLIKPFFSVLLIFLISSCSSSDDGSGSKSSISPPNWILGTWLSDSTGFRFEADDVITIINGVSAVSYKDQLKFYSDAGEEASTEETKTDGSYRLTMNFPAGQSVIYEFSRKSDSVIVWENQASKPEFIKQ
ncbi:hypothetical protein GUA46_03955 [Muricauda sp. HICW]|uniref:Lipocalin-like domain-containing protein n=1 Tax=Flagellimonas chongwuensis TaxID=2697365 RepID=A0A850NDY5_9FLAO|nr:hypothetical protein [Allomuricauda chongwuensis]NVN17486.1 hypothetical protein [Allomuricauda chongwuensis]